MTEKVFQTGQGDIHYWVDGPGAGHNANTDAPEFVNREIEKFVTAVVPMK